jgi:hypothetical protein
MPQQPDDGLYLRIEGRRGGLISFLLTLLKLSPVTTFKCYNNRIEFTKSSLSGEQLVTIPLAAVTAILSGFAKPISYIVAGVVFILLAIIGPILNSASDGLKVANGGIAITCGAISLLFFLVYILKKDMSISVQNGGDVTYGLVFKRSVVENIPVDIEKVKAAGRLINAMVLQATSQR